jgi:hypothetical protein
VSGVRYDAIADVYYDNVGDKFTDAGMAALLEPVGDIGNQRVLDVAASGALTSMPSGPTTDEVGLQSC